MLLRKPACLVHFTIALRGAPSSRCMNQPASRLFSATSMTDSESKSRQYWLVKGEPDVVMKGALDLVRRVSESKS